MTIYVFNGQAVDTEKTCARDIISAAIAALEKARADLPTMGNMDVAAALCPIGAMLIEEAVGWATCEED